MLVMVIERLRRGAIEAIRQRFRSHGRMLPDGVTYLDSWFDVRGERCFQIMEAPDVTALDPWLSAWSDLIAFEITPIQTSESFWEEIDRRSELP